MLSKKIQDAAAMLHQEKNKNKGKRITPESVLADRNRIDGILGNLHFSERILIEKILTNEIEGEFYIYDEKDPEKISDKVMLFLHGGGFMTGSVLSRRKLCQKIMEHTKIDAFSVEYGQWPEHEHPRALNDCTASYRWLLEKGYKSRDIYVFGESAGAMLTFTMILYLKELNEKLPGKAVAFSPVAGQKIDLSSHAELEERDPMLSYESVVPYYSNADSLNPFVSPAYGNFEGFPKLAIHVGSEEVLLDDSKLLYEKCREAGVDVSLKIWDGLFHVFPLFDCPETDAAISEIADFFRGY